MKRKFLLALLAGGTILVVGKFFFDSSGFFSEEGFMPHGHCYLWTPSLVWTMVLTDALIGSSYFVISLCLYLLVRRIQLPFSAMFLAFGTFIAACGATHFMSIYTLWSPSYWFDAFVKLITAVASVVTAILLFRLFPRVLDFAHAARVSEERKKQLEHLNMQLEARTEALVTVNKELEAFSYSVSHDLRTPLRGIDGFSNALLEDYGDRLDVQGKEYLTYVRSGAQRMGQIIDDLLNMSRITRVQMSNQLVDLSQIANETIEYLRRRYPERTVEIKIQDHLKTNGDPGLLRNVLENLLSNAWKFTIETSEATIEVGSEGDETKTVYFIRDNGIGFDMNFAGKLFSAFERLHTATHYSGTGVGLATAKRIIEKHGGRIWAQSKVGQGTTFYFTIGGTNGAA